MFSTAVGVVVAVVVAFGLMGVLFLLAFCIEKKLNNASTRTREGYSFPLTGMVGRRGAVVIGAIRPVQPVPVNRISHNQPVGLTMEQLNGIAPASTFEKVTEKISTELTVEYYESEEKVGSWSDSHQEQPTHSMEDNSGKNGSIGTTDNEYCAICLEEFTPCSLVRRLPCKHLFHSQELERWFAKSSFCPICRVDLTPARQTTVAANVV